MKSFLGLICTICICSNISVARHNPASVENGENHGHSHKLHHHDSSSGRKGSQDEPAGRALGDGGELDSNSTSEIGRDCSSDRHAAFQMPSPSDDGEDDDAGEDKANSGSKDKNDENAVEIRINKYYAVHRDRFYIRNTGRSLEFRLQSEVSSDSEARIRGPDWEDEFVFSKGIFHWQLKNLTVKNPDGTTVFNTESRDPPLEMELIHFAKQYGSLEKAAMKARGVLITGHLFELVGRDNPALEPISRSALSITFPNDNFKQVHGPLDLKSLFPSELSYFEFDGSYPLNPCATVARYIVFKKPLFVSARQLKRFGGLRTEEGKKISDQPGDASRGGGFEVVGKPSGRAGSANAIYLSLVNAQSLPNTAISAKNPGMSHFVKLFFKSVILVPTALQYTCDMFSNRYNKY